MFSVELTFKIAAREVALDKFAEALVARSLEGLRKDVDVLRARPDVPAPICMVERERQPRAVGIERAAELLSISKHTVSK
jgi:hypothetical protein